jgi:glycosyltransferase involved in cell wall biosynthesis
MLRPSDRLTVQALPSLAGQSFDLFDEYEVVRNLPDPSIHAGGRVGRLLRPSKLAVRRSAARRRLLTRGFDVAHLHLLTYQTDWLDLAILPKKTAIVSVVHDVRPHRHSLHPNVEDLLLRRLYAVAGQLVVYGQPLKDELVNDFNVDPRRVDVLPIPRDSADRRDDKIGQPHRPLFLFFGTLRANKGLGVLFDALDEVAREVEADFHIAGAGDQAMNRMVQERASRLPNVSIELGRVSSERKTELLSMASWLILPYTSFHSQSGVLGDAYSFRVPIIASDVGALGPTVRGDATGLVVRPGNSGDLAAAIVKAASTPSAAFRGRIANAARSHDYSVVGPRLREIYDTAVANQRSRQGP